MPERRFWFRLALRLGCSVREAQERIDAHEFAEWLAYYALEPWGEERADLRAGIIASTVANGSRDAKKRPRPFRATEFMPQFDRPEADGNALLAVVEQLNAALGGEDRRNNG